MDNELIEKYEIEPEKLGFHSTDNVIAQYRQDLITAFWPAEEAVSESTMSADIVEFSEMDEDERHFIISTLILFLISDDFVGEVIEHEFLKRIKNRIWRGYEIHKAAIEDIHSQAYKRMLEFLVPDRVDEYAVRVRDEYSYITDKIKWCRESLGGSTRLAHCVFIMTIIELLFFSTSFATIFWYKSINKLPGIAYANEMIARDEGSHGTFNIYIYNTLEHKLSPDEAVNIIKAAVEIECTFITSITPTRLGINKDLLCDYAKFMADDIMINMGYDKIYNVELSLTYMSSFGIRRRTDFFRKKDTQYQAFSNETFKPLHKRIGKQLEDI